jgi:hypothetical protein
MSCDRTTKGPLPVKFYEGENKFLRAAQRATGVPMVELVRRGVRLMERQQQLLHSYGFVLDLQREQDSKR